MKARWQRVASTTLALSSSGTTEAFLQPPASALMRELVQFQELL